MQIARRGKAATSAHFLVDFEPRLRLRRSTRSGRFVTCLAGTVRDACSARILAEAEDRMLREIVLDTETTGIDHGKGDRVIEIGCVELVNHVPTGQILSRLHQPGAPGLAGRVRRPRLRATTFLADKPVFAAVAEDFADLHRRRAPRHPQRGFDVGFLNAELPPRTGHPAIVLNDVRRHPVARPAQASGRVQQPRRARAPAMASTIRGAPSTGRFSTPRSWPKSISS